MRIIRLFLLEVLLLADVAVLIGYRHIVQSSNLFVTAQTVFYPLIALNIAAAVVVPALIIREFIARRK